MLRRVFAFVLILGAVALAGQPTAGVTYTAIVTGSEPPIGTEIRALDLPSQDLVIDGATWTYHTYPEPTGSYTSAMTGGIWVFNSGITHGTFTPCGVNGMGPNGTPIGFDVTPNTP